MSVEYKQTSGEALFSGTFAGALTPFSSQPFFNSKIEQQTNGGSLIEAFKKLTLEKKIYNGVMINSGVNAAVYGAQYFCYKKILKIIGGENPSKKQEVIASLWSAFFTFLPCNATEMVIIRKGLMIDEFKILNRAKPTYLQVILDIYRNQGLKGFAKGWKFMFLRELVFVPTFCIGGPWIANIILNFIHNKPISDLIGGSLAGASGSSVSHFADTNQTRLKKDQQVTRVPKELFQGVGTRCFYVGMELSLFTMINRIIKDFQKQLHK